MNLHRLSRKSLDADGDDDGSISKHGSCQRSSALNSDSECVGDGPISVRDMIRYYDSSSRQDIGQHSVRSQINVTQKQSHTVLFSRKSTSQSGLEYQESPPPSKFNLLPTMPRGCFEKKISLNSNSNVCCQNCSACHCCQNRNLKSSVAAIEDVQRNDIATNPNVDNLAVLRNSSPSSATTKKTCLEFRDDMNASRQPPPNVRTVMQKNHLLSNDSAEEATCHPIETSYQSKTTIAKTANGVRIIIDIFFNPEQCVNASDVLGSRVETDIPQSRILDEFQQQLNAANATTSNPVSASGSAIMHN